MDEKERDQRMKKFSAFLVDRFRDWLQSKDAPPPTKGSVASQVDFAKWLKIDPSNLSYFINQRRYCSVDQAEKIASRLGSQVYDIFGYPRKAPEDQLTLTILDYLEEMDEEGKQGVLELIAARKGKKTIAA